MATSFGVATPQTVPVNQPIAFTRNANSDNGLVFQRNSGVFLLASNAPDSICGCGCRRIYETEYEVSIHANIEIPTGGTVGEIRLALAVDGIVDPDSVMSFVPAAVATPGNVGSAIMIGIPSICGCENVAVVNASDQPITVNNASLVIDYSGVRRIR